MRRPAERGSWDLLARLIAGEHWQSVAACRTAEPDLFFPVSASENSLPQVAEAKEICGRCMARGRCLKFAIETRQQYGIWGGLTEEERYPLVRAELHRPLAR
ncbi:MAG TPA: WhiB family transcriptional regulator [Trebonia sp.]|jgi:WhiB family redox-sensing transcriptional regulator|nr:WhiB family transcriptional regulator [Trebonia sp.]